MNIFIGNLNEKIQDIHLKEAFSDYGSVESAKVITDRYTKKSKGYGFIVMPDDAEAQKAIDTLNGGKWEGNIIVVNKAKNKI
ncbi:MAG: RNA-binding protein [Bacteroidales bacterium]|nr:RNA-binding protein [Bacteroidales bacterium]